MPLLPLSDSLEYPCNLISSLKTFHRTLHLTPWSLDLFIHVPLQLPGEHTPIVHIAISVLPGTQCLIVLSKDTSS